MTSKYCAYWHQSTKNSASNKKSSASQKATDEKKPIQETKPRIDVSKIKDMPKQKTTIKSTKQHQGKENSKTKESPKVPSENGRSITMRVGRKIRKTAVEQKKTKPCFVRLEKVQEEKQESPERVAVNKKLTGPLKKRPLNTPSQVAKRVEEPPETVASTRSRRAPKPNPKYSNADIITPKTKTRRGRLVDEAITGDSDSSQDYYNALDETSYESGTNDGDVADVFDEESSDYSENEEILRPKRPLRNTTPTTERITPTVKRGRPKRTYSPAPQQKLSESKKAGQHHGALQRPTVTGSSQQLQQSKKRKLETDEEDEPPESIIARNKRLNIALYDSNVAKPLPTHKNAVSKTVNSANSRTQSPSTGTLSQKKHITNPIKASSASKDEEKSKSPLNRRSPATSAKASDGKDAASTQDDFETMPTFTIVNIHDIINKKGDSLVQKSAEESQGATSPTNANRVNRRKTGHTTILSEKIDPGKLRSLPRTPYPPRKPISTILNSGSSTRAEPRTQSRPSITSAERRITPAADKPAPRILNSVVAKRTYPVQPILGKLDNDYDLQPSEDPIEKTQMVKENVGANKVLPVKPALPRKLPAEKVFVQRQGNKLIKKITCFETWYVINIPETQEPVVKNCLKIPLITLSNAAKTIRLPSSAWSTKVTLQKLSNQMIGRASIVPFTGDLSDQSIAEEDRDKYQPSCVMFRRMTQQKSRTRMPYDRAVIFKMKTFFTNIDGKNVRLVGAPSTINSFDEVEVLLELVDELDLQHEFVEQTNTV